MGCDIHIFTEKKVGNKWVMVNELKGRARDRNYGRFAALAGVRGEGPSPKGLPSDASDSVLLHNERWGSDGHSHSWLSANEAASIFLTTEFNPKDYMQEYPLSAFFDIEDEMETCKCCGQPVPMPQYRVVFWFDN